MAHPSSKPVKDSLEIIYETVGDTVFCWLFGPERLVLRAKERFFATYPYGSWGSKEIQRITLEDNWVSVGLSRRLGGEFSKGGRSFYQKALATY